MGSVKDLKIVADTTKSNMGIGRFYFSDRYSVFDWGEMPDEIPRKGEAIAILSAYFFERFKNEGILTHYEGLIEESCVKQLKDVKKPTNIIEVKLLNIIKPVFKSGTYDYSAYKFAKHSFLIPLEIIYRNELPKGSSVFKRLETGNITLQELNLDEKPLQGHKFKDPFIDYSTKFEITDRYLNRNEAMECAGLTELQIQKIEEQTLKISKIISEEFSKIGFVNQDGKVEYGFDLNRSLMLVDVAGTLDECRFSYNGIQISKEIARTYYRNTAWHLETERAKNENRENWKAICKLQPEPLPPKLKILISNIYCAVTNEITNKKWFENIPSLKELKFELESMPQQK